MRTTPGHTAGRQQGRCAERSHRKALGAPEAPQNPALLSGAGFPTKTKHRCACLTCVRAGLLPGHRGGPLAWVQRIDPLLHSSPAAHSSVGTAILHGLRRTGTPLRDRPTCACLWDPRMPSAGQPWNVTGHHRDPKVGPPVSTSQDQRVRHQPLPICSPLEGKFPKRKQGGTPRPSPSPRPHGGGPPSNDNDLAHLRAWRGGNRSGPSRRRGRGVPASSRGCN